MVKTYMCVLKRNKTCRSMYFCNWMIIRELDIFMTYENFFFSFVFLDICVLLFFTCAANDYFGEKKYVWFYIERFERF